MAIYLHTLSQDAHSESHIKLHSLDAYINEIKSGQIM